MILLLSFCCIVWSEEIPFIITEIVQGSSYLDCSNWIRIKYCMFNCGQFFVKYVVWLAEVSCDHAETVLMQNINLKQVEIVADDVISSEKCTLVLTGYLRAHGLSVNQLVIYSVPVIVFCENGIRSMSESFYDRFILLELGIFPCLRSNFSRIHLPWI